MSTPFFHFRQFTVWHDRCAMKVGTDGVLLGAWTALPDSSNVRVLDVGVGSGLISLMLAQRLTECQRSFCIEGIDVDSDAVTQANLNFSLSPWSNDLTAHVNALQTYGKEKTFDLIVSNPPYFVDSLRCPNSQRTIARHTDTLTYSELIYHGARLLAPNGLLSLIAPSHAEQQLLELASVCQLVPVVLTHFFSSVGKPAKRVLVTLTDASSRRYRKSELIKNELILNIPEYHALVDDFYL